VDEVRQACQSECSGMHTPLFKEYEIDRAESIVNALDGLDIYSAHQLLEKVSKYLLLTTFMAHKE